MLGVVAFDMLFGKRLIHENGNPDNPLETSIIQVGSTHVMMGRNIICHRFLKESTADWLVFIDTDQEFPPNILERLIESADPDERPIVSALIMALARNIPAAVSSLKAGRWDRSKYMGTELSGKVIGVVGRSGSGKTTLTRLMQGIQNPTEGIIKLDGVDLRQIDLAHLRKNVGIVLQESFLFRGSIRDNIAASNPDASPQEVVGAARLAGAEEFIDQLPMAYESVLEEGATNLSGGQRQRIAIARALLPQPKFLIFDEATSALDPESEAIIQNNLSEISRGRSMIVVSHRLSSLVTSDAILVLDKGRVVDFAPHAELVKRCEIYAHLWDQQTRNITGAGSPAAIASASPALRLG
jgi:ABC-type polar amino acid transport system ATPase subunit